MKLSRINFSSFYKRKKKLYLCDSSRLKKKEKEQRQNNSTSTPSPHVRIQNVDLQFDTLNTF